MRDRSPHIAAGVSCDIPSATSDVSHIWFQVGLWQAIPSDPESIPPHPHPVLLLRILDTRCYISFECITATTQVYTLRYAHQGCSHHLSPQYIITVSLTIFLMPRLSSPRLIHSVTGNHSLHPFCPFPTPLPSGCHRFPESLQS